LPAGAGLVLPEASVQLPGEAAVAALEEDAGVAARVDETFLLARRDHPDPLQLALAPLGQREAGALLPLARRVVRHPHLGAVEPGGDGGQVAAAARVAGGVLDGLPRERPRLDLERPARLALEHEQPLARTHQQLCHAVSLL